MKKILFYVSVILLITFNFGTSYGQSLMGKGPLVVDSRKALTGTFVDFSKKTDWTVKKWESQFQEMEDIGINSVIVQYTSYGDTTWFNSANTFTHIMYPEALARLLAAANHKKMAVYIGLYFDESYWNNQTNVEWLLLHADRCIFIAIEINEKYGKDPAFKGWYIPHEPEPNAYHTKELITSFNVNLVNRISDRLHSFDSKPVSIAAFFNHELTSTSQLKDFMAELCKSNLQIIMLQDGIGVNHVSLEQVGQYFKEADKGLYENSNYKGEYWTDLETFSFAPQGPVTIDRIMRQIHEEMVTKHISKAVTFQYYNDMCPEGPGGRYSALLRKKYIDFITGTK